MTLSPRTFVLTVALVVASVAGAAGEEKDCRITPERLGLPKGNTRTSEPFVVRIYKTDDLDQPLKPQPPGYPFTIHEDYRLKKNERPIVHKGVDISSHLAGEKTPKPLDFRGGVYGIVVKAGGGPWGTISVQLQDGTILQYLHTTASHVKKGDLVAPDTLLGVTGKRGANAIHLHIQARDSGDNFILPDLAFCAGQQKLTTPIKPNEAAGKDFDPDQSVGAEPKVVDGVVKVKVETKTKWIVEVIGAGGRVDLKLGEYPTYRDALYRSLTWSREHPKDLRLTREREVPVVGKK